MRTELVQDTSQESFERTLKVLLWTKDSILLCRHSFYSLRVVKCWNSLPAELVQATSQESFKRQLDLFLRTKNIITL
ncbi:unnamed protein product [Schistosoma margrebowiei]|uniref:Uncharacterized protein n=1 Tax=Schistosoma margrebowiei TaxID=48269 RepID=A0A3P8B3H8_9TREM|nr:unnamed protein product [Schistosoma margrebowiei]